METLKEFYYKKVWTIDLTQRHHAILEIDDVVVINFDVIYERECGLRAVDQLLYFAHKIGHGKRFLFISEDGANIRLSGGLNLINNLINTFGLTKDTCAIIAREPIQIENATVVVRESIIDWCKALYPWVKDVPISTGPFTKKFAVWFNRGTIFRLHLAKHLLDNYATDSFISYQEPEIWLDWKLREYAAAEISWAKTHAPVVFDELFPNRNFNFDLIVGAQRKPYAEYFIEIVGETDILTTNWITEKTVKNLFIGKPFIIMGAPGSLAKIKDLGFRTFDKWIDESYDEIENIHLRLEHIKKEIDRLAVKNLDELAAMSQEMTEVFVHNRKRYEFYVKEHVWQIF